MKKFDETFDIVLSGIEGQTYQRRLGIRERRSGRERKLSEFEIAPNGPQGICFPDGPEEAAFLMVGLKYWSSLPEDNRQKRNHYINREGLSVYSAIIFALDDGTLKDLTIGSLYHWSKQPTHIPTLKHFPHALSEEMRAISLCLKKGKPQKFEPSWNARAIPQIIESQTGYEASKTILKDGEFVPEDPMIGKKGREMVRLKNQIENHAKIFLKKNPSARPKDFLDSSVLKDLLKELLPGKKPGEETIRRWIQHLPFNRSPGRPRD